RVLGALDHRVADTLGGLLDAVADLALADLLGAGLDLTGRGLDLGIVSRRRQTHRGQQDRDAERDAEARHGVDLPADPRAWPHRTSALTGVTRSQATRMEGGGDGPFCQLEYPRQPMQRA